MAGGSGVGGMIWEVDEQSIVVLRHWSAALWNEYDRWEKWVDRTSSFSFSDSLDVMRIETCCGTEPRVSSLLKYLNTLNTLVIYLEGLKLSLAMARSIEILLAF